MDKDITLLIWSGGLSVVSVVIGVVLGGLISRWNATQAQRQAWQRDYKARQIEPLKALLDRASNLHETEELFDILRDSPILKAAKTQLIADFLAVPAGVRAVLSKESWEDAQKAVFDLTRSNMGREEWFECWSNAYSEVVAISIGETT